MSYTLCLAGADVADEIDQALVKLHGSAISRVSQIPFSFFFTINRRREEQTLMPTQGNASPPGWCAVLVKHPCQY